MIAPIQQSDRPALRRHDFAKLKYMNRSITIDERLDNDNGDGRWAKSDHRTGADSTESPELVGYCWQVDQYFV